MPKGIQGLLRYFSLPWRRSSNMRDRRFPRPVAWGLGLAVFLTAVTIAAIIPRRADSLPANAPVLSIPPAPTGVTNAPSGTDPITSPATLAETANTKTSDRDAWTEVRIRKGDTLSDILKREGYANSEINRVIQSNPETRLFRQLRPGQSLRLRAEAQGPLQELVYEPGPGEGFHLVRHENRFELTKEIRTFETRLATVTGTIGSSLFEEGQKAGLSDGLIMKLAEIFGWDIDFALDLRRGDSFSVIHEEKYWRGQKIADGPILAAEFINQGHVFRAIVFRDGNGNSAYYTPDGMSVRRPFLRTPVEFSRITSRFSNSRFHPILKKWRAHHGVDYGAPTGTPVHATATGRIFSIGWDDGYGKRIVIRHNVTYSTVYAHLSRFNPNLHVGSFVEQGQTIGYVGATGLASGPHLHYEFQVNGVHRNPLTFRFPGSTPIAPEHRDEFARLAKTWSAQLDLIGHSRQIAVNR